MSKHPTPLTRRAPVALPPLKARLERLRDELRVTLMAGRDTTAIRHQVDIAERDLATAEQANADVVDRRAAQIAADLEADVATAEAAWRTDLAALCRPIPPIPMRADSPGSSSVYEEGSPT